MSTHEDDDRKLTAYGFKVGERLREIRRQQRISLQEVEAASGGEFKASVLGAYERGERAISVPRLERLARLYNVPVDQLLPPQRARPEAPAAGGPGYLGPVTIDLEKVDGYDGPEANVLHRFVRMVQVQRQDFTGTSLTVRSSELVALAAILNTPIEYTSRRLDELGLRFESGSGDQITPAAHWAPTHPVAR